MWVRECVSKKECVTKYEREWVLESENAVSVCVKMRERVSVRECERKWKKEWVLESENESERKNEC